MYFSALCHRRQNTAPLALLCVLLLSLPRPALPAPAPVTGPVAVYTHASPPTQALSDAALRSIFSMRLTLWPDGSRIQVVVLGDAHPLHRQFSKSILGLFPYQLRQLWDRGVFSGTGEAPLQASNEKQMLEILMTTPGAIGYLLQQPITEGIHLVERP